MTRTIWFAVFCLVGLGAAAAIKTATPSAGSAVESIADQSNIELAAVPNELTKSDRLPLPNLPLPSLPLPSAPVESVATEASVPPAMMPAETPPAEPDTIKKVEHRHWQDANARIVPTESSRQRFKRNEPRKTEGTTAANARTVPWHCRRDAMGSLLRSLDLSPRCDL
jgi:hypothetical protein